MQANKSDATGAKSHQFARVSALICGLYGLLVILAWPLRWDPVLRVLAGQTAMNPATAVMLTLCSFAVVWKSYHPKSVGVSESIGTMLAAAGVFRLAGYALHFDPYFDSLFYSSLLNAEPVPNRIAPLTALALTFLGMALVTRNLHLLHGQMVGQFFALLALLTGYLALAGYALGLDAAGKVGIWIPMAFNTSISVMLLGAAILASQPERGFTAIALNKTISGRSLRFAVATGFLVPLVVGITVTTAARRGAMDLETAMAALVTLTTGLIVLASYHGARHADNHEMASLRAREALQRFRAALDCSPTGVYVIDQERLVIIDANETAIRTSGLSGRELMGKRVADFEPLRPLTRLVDQMKDKREGDAIVFESTLRRPGGAKTPLEVHVSRAILDGTPHLIAVSSDISERVEAERELFAVQRRLQAILDNSPAVIYVKDLKGRYVVHNKRLVELFGTGLQSLIGKTDKEVFGEEIAREFRKNDEEVLRSLTALEFEEAVRQGDETRLYLSIKFPLLDADGHAEAVCGISTDITERKAAELEAELARRQAEIANEAKSVFLSRMSHELRTPLNAIIGFAQLMELHGCSPQQQEFVGHIEKAGQHLLKMIDEILDIAKIEAGKLSTSLEPVDYASVMRSAMELIEPAASERSIKMMPLRVEAGSQYVYADRHRLLQVMLNLLSNAVKFGDSPGQVTIAAHEIPGNLLRVTVENTGKGVPEEKRPLLFTPFERFHPQTEGTGLGLAVSKGLIEAMQGRIGYDDTYEPGARFWFELRLSQSPVLNDEAKERVRAYPDLPSGANKVVYIEDNLANAEVMRHLVLLRPDIELFTAADAAQGMALIERERPKLVLLDLHLPGANGLDVLTELKGRKGKSPHVVIVSADATKETQRLARARGADGFLTKPFQISEVLHAIDRALFSETGPGAERESSQGFPDLDH